MSIQVRVIYDTYLYIDDNHTYYSLYMYMKCRIWTSARESYPLPTVSLLTWIQYAKNHACFVASTTTLVYWWIIMILTFESSKAQDPPLPRRQEVRQQQLRGGRHTVQVLPWQSSRSIKLLASANPQHMHWWSRCMRSHLGTHPTPVPERSRERAPTDTSPGYW